MSKFRYTDEEKKINNILKSQSQQLENLKKADMSAVNSRIMESESLLKCLGYSLPDKPKKLPSKERSILVIPSWDELCVNAGSCEGNNTTLDELFSLEELEYNSHAIRALKTEYDSIHKLDKVDITISSIAGLIGAAVDALLVGMPQKTQEGLKTGPLSNYIRDFYDKKFPKEEMDKLANSKLSKVPYDAQDNRNTKKHVEGLSAYYHRLLSLGHDPLLGLIVGIFDIMNGSMTTIDKTGKIASQVMENYSDRKETDLFAAIVKQILHFKTDINTSMGLPVPLMSLFSLCQFGSIGHSSAAAINAGKVCFTKNPIAVNYSQWIVFAKYSYKQLKWVMLEKSEKRNNYIHDIMYKELKQIYTQINADIEEYLIVMEN